MAISVFYEAWQLQCCGAPFRLGERVTWTATHADPGGNAWLRTIIHEDVDWFEEHHQADDQPVSRIEGEVTSIRGLWVKRAPDEPGGTLHVPVPGTAVTEEINRADGWDEGDGSAHPLHAFEGYLVTLG